jgi:hypothetical protein
LREQKQHEVALGLDLGSQICDLGLTLLHVVGSAVAPVVCSFVVSARHFPIELELRACRMSSFA